MAMEMTSDPGARRRLPLVENPGKSLRDETAGDAVGELSEAAIEAELRALEEVERQRRGVRAERRQWVDTMLNPTMKKAERGHVTLLISGLTAAQDFLVEGALRGLGYNVEYFGMSDNAGLQAGKEFGNRGQCNPTYFTVGSLVKHLIDLRDKHGLTSQEIVQKYVYLTAGACGPCRFGMYVTEYRKALRDAGFDGFRVMLFQQQGGLSQATGEDVGLEMNPPFFIAIIKAIVCGDVLNALGYRIRPYEVEPGATDKAIEAAKRILYTALQEGTNVFVALYRSRKVLEGVAVDWLRQRPRVSIIGEFWAMTTEGEGNYRLQRFLESESGECDIQLTTAWLLYNIWEVARDTRERQFLRDQDGGIHGLDGMGEFGVAKRLATMRVAEAALRVGFQAFALPTGLNGYKLPDMELIADFAKDYYSNDLRGGEGHMEVGKLIANAVMSKAHLTVSVKPFGCMPSSGVSDGVQSLVTAKQPNSLFCAVETSGDGAANFYSRVQMYMYKARILAEQELEKAYTDCGVTEAEVRAYLAKHARTMNALHHPPHRVAGTAANVVYEVAPLIKLTRAEKAVAAVKRAASGAKGAANGVARAAARAGAAVKDEGVRARVKEDARLVADLVRGKAKERFGPLAQTLLGRAAE